MAIDEKKAWRRQKSVIFLALGGGVGGEKGSSRREEELVVFCRGEVVAGTDKRETRRTQEPNAEAGGGQESLR